MLLDNLKNVEIYFSFGFAAHSLPGWLIKQNFLTRAQRNEQREISIGWANKIHLALLFSLFHTITLCEMPFCLKMQRKKHILMLMLRIHNKIDTQRTNTHTSQFLPLATISNQFANKKKIYGEFCLNRSFKWPNLNESKVFEIKQKTHKSKQRKELRKKRRKLI